MLEDPLPAEATPEFAARAPLAASGGPDPGFAARFDAGLERRTSKLVDWKHNAEATVDEAEQISQVHPRLGRWLLPPCGLRARSGAKPPCPEGTRYCGIPVWKLDVSQYRRLN